MKKILLVSIFILVAGFILCAGCSSYAPPELTIVPTIQQVTVSPDLNRTIMITSP